MSGVHKEERYDLELKIYAAKHEGADVYAWLKMRRAELDATWPGLVNNELLQAQGEARGYMRLIKLFEQGPAIKDSRKTT